MEKTCWMCGSEFSEEVETTPFLANLPGPTCPSCVKVVSSVNDILKKIIPSDLLDRIRNKDVGEQLANIEKDIVPTDPDRISKILDQTDELDELAGAAEYFPYYEGQYSEVFGDFMDKCLEEFPEVRTSVPNIPGADLGEDKFAVMVDLAEEGKENIGCRPRGLMFVKIGDKKISVSDFTNQSVITLLLSGRAARTAGRTFDVTVVLNYIRDVGGFEVVVPVGSSFTGGTPEEKMQWVREFALRTGADAISVVADAHVANIQISGREEADRVSAEIGPDISKYPKSTQALIAFSRGYGFNYMVQAPYRTNPITGVANEWIRTPIVIDMDSVDGRVMIDHFSTIHFPGDIFDVEI